MRRQFELWTDCASDPCKNARRSPCGFPCKSQLVTKRVVQCEKRENSRHRPCRQFFWRGFHPRSASLIGGTHVILSFVLGIQLNESTTLSKDRLILTGHSYSWSTYIRKKPDSGTSGFRMICLERSNQSTSMRNDSIRMHDTLPLNEGAMACTPFRFSHWIGFVMLCV